MKKEDIELIIFKVTANGQDAVNMKIYKDGTVCRYGVGALPEIGISGMSFFEDSKFFSKLIEDVPQQVLENPINYEEQTPNGSVEYALAFLGVSKNGLTGEQAEWTQSTGIRLYLDQQSSFNHPIRGLVDVLTTNAIELTNEWYFDIIMNAKFKVLSSTLPAQTIISQPKTEMEIHRDYENYITQMMQSARAWSMADFDKNKTYSNEGQVLRGFINHTPESFNINFVDVSRFE